MWLSLHLYHARDLPEPEVDRLLVERVAPLTDRLRASGRVGRFFFVRYRDPERHVRLRLDLAGGAGESGVTREVAAELAEAPGGGVELRRREYEPEWRRYGGAHSLALAEDHFLLSSQTALEVLAATLDGGAARRLGKALLLAVILAWSFCEAHLGRGGRHRGRRDDARRFLEWYAEAYLQTLFEREDERDAFRRRLAGAPLDTDAVSGALEALLTAFETGEGLGVSLLDRWTQGCGTTARRLADLHGEGRLAGPPPPAGGGYLWPLSASYLHMHHNRLGCSVAQEIHLTRAAAAALAGAEAE